MCLIKIQNSEKVRLDTMGCSAQFFYMPLQSQCIISFVGLFVQFLYCESHFPTFLVVNSFIFEFFATFLNISNFFRNI